MLARKYGVVQDPKLLSGQGLTYGFTTMSTPFLVAELTPVGRGAVAVVACRGTGVGAALDVLAWRPRGKRSSQLTVGELAYGRWQQAEGEEIVLSRLADNQWEVHCHGGTAAVRAVMEGLTAHGGHIVASGEFLAGEQEDPIAAAAYCDLALAATERVAAVLLDQARGALRRELDQLQRDVESGELALARHRCESLLGWAEFGRHLTVPWKVVIAGPPNVGKSSLLNALVGYARSIVFPEPGTTRDVVTAFTALEGWPVELADTAGLRSAVDAVEQTGIDWAQAAASQADLVLHVRDGSQPASAAASEFALSDKSLVVWNKADLVALTTQAQHSGSWVSALTGAGLPELCQAIAARLVPRAPLPGTPVPFRPEQVEYLKGVMAGVG